MTPPRGSFRSCHLLSVASEAMGSGDHTLSHPSSFWGLMLRERFRPSLFQRGSGVSVASAGV